MVENQENVPRRWSRILRSELGEMIAWSSMEGSFKYITAVSFYLISYSRKMKGGIRLWSMDGTERMFLAVDI